MRVLSRTENQSRWGALNLGLLAGLAVLALPIPADALSAPDTAPAPGLSNPNYASGIDGILRMVDAKVNVEVIKAYIKNSTVAYNLSASEIITLKERGVPDEVVAALLQRGGELRANAAPIPQTTPSTMPYPYPQAPSYSPPPDYGQYGQYGQTPDYGYDYGAAPYYAGYGYPYYSYGYPYPYNYWWWNNYWYPWAFSSPFFFNFNHFHNGHFHDGHFHDGHFHNGHFHNGFPNHQGAFARGTFANGSASFAGRTSPFGTFRNFGSRPTVAVNRSAFGTFRGGGFSGGHSMGGGGHAMGGGHGMGGGHR